MIMLIVTVIVNVVVVCDSPLVQEVAGVSLASAAAVSVQIQAVAAGMRRARTVCREVV
jgi:hypothetical protein